jgi:hypothetical protein
VSDKSQDMPNWTMKIVLFVKLVALKPFSIEKKLGLLRDGFKEENGDLFPNPGFGDINSTTISSVTNFSID